MRHRETPLRRPFRRRRSPRRPAWLWPTVGALVVVGVLVAAIGLLGRTTQESHAAGAEPSPTPVAIASQSMTADPSVVWTDGDRPEGSIAGDGLYEVGSDIPAGKYKTPGPADAKNPSCYWARRRLSADQSTNVLIESARTRGQAVVTVKSDEVFETAGCRDWHKVA